MLCDYFSACKLLSNCFVKKTLSDAYIGLAGPYQYFGWYGPGHTASAALVPYPRYAIVHTMCKEALLRQQNTFSATNAPT